MYGLGVLRGMALTLKHLLMRRPVTVQYPTERLPLQERFRGTQFLWYEERCTGCSLCAKACPNGVITVVGHSDPTGREGKRIIDRYDMDLAICLYCGLCVEACPFYALFMGNEFELSTYIRGELRYDKHKLTKVVKAKRPKVELPTAMAPVQAPQELAELVRK